MLTFLISSNSMSISLIAEVYIYKDYKTYEDKLSFTSEPLCITVVPCTNKAVVTLLGERSIQFINSIYVPYHHYNYKIVICCQK
jgi:hypothetical protein